MNAIEIIREQYSSLSKGKQKIANFILDNIEEVAFSPAIVIAKKVGASETAVVRLANDLGFRGYREMQDAIQDTLKRRLNIINRIEQSLSFDGKENEMVYLKSFEQDILNLNETIKSILPETFTQAVKMIIGAKRIGVIGMRAAAAPATVLQLYLNELLDNVYLLTPGLGESFDRIKNWGNEDLLIGCAFIVSKNFTSDMLNYGRKKGCKTLAVTDDVLSATAHDAGLIIPVKSKGTFVSFTAAMSVINIILQLVSQETKESGKKSLLETEEILYKHLLRGDSI